MEQTAAQLLTTLKRPAINSDSKIATLNALKSDIKHYRVPETAQPPIFDCLRLALTQSASSQLVHCALSTLAHLLKRLSIQDASGNAIQQLAPRLLPALQDRMGDLREAIRGSASAALSELHPFLGGEVERIVREEAIGAGNVRAKEAGMGWVVRMHREENMPFKSFVGPIVASLEDADGNVREAAKNALVSLFGGASDRAKADLRRQLKAHQVRLSIEAQVLTQLGMSGRPAPPKEKEKADEREAMTGSTRSLPAVDHVAQFAETLNSEAAQPPPQETVQMDPLYVHTERELNETFADMMPHFEGKETEQNWMLRDKSVLKLRRLLKGNAPSEFHHAFMAGIKSLCDGILKVANSLRTTTSSNGCHLVQELARTLGPALDPHTEIFLQSFVKMSSATKHIASENGRHTADAVFQHCSYHARLMQHIWAAAQDKNASTRQCAPEWLRTMLRRMTGYKSYFESSGGLDLAEKSIRKGLDDANPKVKEGMRHTFWIFAKGWPEKADVIMGKLDPKSKALLEKDPNNPNASLHASTAAPASSARPAAGSRSALKEMMAEQRRAKSAGRNLPERPGSAMAALSPQKTRAKSPAPPNARGPSKLRSESRAVSGTSTTSTTASSNANASAATKGSSLMSGPVRRPRRPEIQRPQTADPYASRRLLRAETPVNSTPSNSPPKGTGASKASTATSSASASRNRARTAGQPAPSREGSPNVRRSPLPGVRRGLQDSYSSRPTSKDSNTPMPEDDLTMVMPSRGIPVNKRTAALSHPRPGFEKTASVDSGLPSLQDGDPTDADADNFTMVMPSFSASARERGTSPQTYRSPLKAMFDSARDLADRPSSSSSQQNGSTMHKGQQSDPFASRQPYLSPQRAGSRSPTKSTSPAPPAQAEVQIYEDPSHSPRSAHDGAQGGRPALSELPVNENLRALSPERAASASPAPDSPPRDATPAPQSVDKGELHRNARLLTSGLERLRARTLDAHGFRRVQELARTSPPALWEAEGVSGRRFEDLVAALLEYLRGFSAANATATATPGSKVAALRAQTLATLRVCLTTQRKLASKWFAPALATLMAARRDAEREAGGAGNGSDFERTARDLAALAPPFSSLEALVAHLSTAAPDEGEDGAGKQPAPRTTTLALHTTRSLTLSARERKLALPSALKTDMARAVAKVIGDEDAEVRKAGVELATVVFWLFDEKNDGEGLGKEEFWNAFKGVEEGRLGLLTYYIARGERGT